MIVECETKCFSCKNAVPTKDGKWGCPWSRDFEPVEGWVAEPTIINEGVNDSYDSYCVMECPLFIPDDIRKDSDFNVLFR